MKFNKERLAGAASVALRFLLWLPVLAAAAFFGAASGESRSADTPPFSVGMRTV